MLIHLTLNISQPQHRTLGVIRDSLGAGMTENLVNIAATVVIDYNQICTPLVGGFYDFFPIFAGPDLKGYVFITVGFDKFLQHFFESIRSLLA